MKHPVVNDTNIELWERLGVTCWPTLVIISPSRQLLHCIIGEGHADEFHLFMETAVGYYEDALNKDDIEIVTRKNVNHGQLSFPGKVCYCEENGVLFVADSSNHRILSVKANTGDYMSNIFIAYIRDDLYHTVPYYDCNIATLKS